MDVRDFRRRKWLGRSCTNLALRARAEQPLLSPSADYALRFAVLRFAPVLRVLVLRAAPRADAAFRVVLRFAPPFFFDVIGMSNDSSCVWSRATRTPQNARNMGEFLLTMQHRRSAATDANSQGFVNPNKFQRFRCSSLYG